MLPQRSDDYEHIDGIGEPTSGHQTLCSSQTGFSHLASPSDKLAQRKPEVSPHARLSGGWLWQDHLASKLEPIVTEQQSSGRLGLSRRGGQRTSLVLDIRSSSSPKAIARTLSFPVDILAIATTSTSELPLGRAYQRIGGGNRDLSLNPGRLSCDYRAAGTHDPDVSNRASSSPIAYYCSNTC